MHRRPRLGARSRVIDALALLLRAVPERVWARTAYPVRLAAKIWISFRLDRTTVSIRFGTCLRLAFVLHRLDLVAETARTGELGRYFAAHHRDACMVLALASAPPRRSKPPEERIGPVTAAVTALACRIAGPAFGWTRQAWRADLAHGPYGRSRPMPDVLKFVHALGLLVWTAPRYRLIQVAGVLGRTARVTSIRALKSDAAIGLGAGAVLVATSLAIWSESGLTGVATFLSTGVPATAWGVRWIRHRTRTDERADRSCDP